MRTYVCLSQWLPKFHLSSIMIFGLRSTKCNNFQETRCSYGSIFCSMWVFLKKLLLTCKKRECGIIRRLQRIKDFVHTQVTRPFITIECAEAVSSLAESSSIEKKLLWEARFCHFPNLSVLCLCCEPDCFLKFEWFSDSFDLRVPFSIYTISVGLGRGSSSSVTKS